MHAKPSESNQKRTAIFQTKNGFLMHLRIAYYIRVTLKIKDQEIQYECHKGSLKYLGSHSQDVR